MLKDLRAIWAEDQYMVLGHGPTINSYLVGREKSGTFHVYLRNLASRKRKLVHFKSISLSEGEDLFWCNKNFELTDNPELVSEIEKSENILNGFFYGDQCTDELTSICARTFTVPLATGAEVTWLLPDSLPVGWIVSFHGGPESAEGLEIRYGGLYRDLLNLGYGIAILNYRGSTGLSDEVSQRVWGNWEISILEDFEALLNVANKYIALEDCPKLLFGVSFGGALALLVQKEHSVNRTVISSPLLDLEFQRKRAGDSFKDWFDSRFSEKDFKSFSYSNLINTCSSSVNVCYSKTDEVVGSEMFLRLEKDQQRLCHWKLFEDSAGHSPKTYFQFRSRFDRIYDLLHLD